MHINYEDARITLVHDCFLRACEWFDAETACFAIIMSPWFSRGWTALELAKSPKVKVVFKNSIIKDLDEDILSISNTDSKRHKVISGWIQSLRLGTVTTINDLLTVLHSRSTSWPRDIPIISGLLTGVEIKSGATQQEIYRDVVKKIGKVSHDHLFHNSTTVSERLSWYPTNLLDLTVSPRQPTLHIHENGDVSGPWRVYDSLQHIGEKKLCDWKNVHPLTQLKLLLALQDPESHRLLAVPDGPVTKALLVKPTGTDDTKKHQFIGSVYFHSPLPSQTIGDQTVVEVTIAHAETPRQPKSTVTTQNHVKSVEDLLLALQDGEEERACSLLDIHGLDLHSKDERTWTALHYASWRCYDSVVERLIESDQTFLDLLDVPDCLGQRAIHFASERGNERVVKRMLEGGADPNVQCHDKQTALHRAAWGGSKGMVHLLLSKGADPDIQDSKGWTPLHLAAEAGNEVVVKLLLVAGADVGKPNYDKLRSLHIAAERGNNALVRLLQDTEVARSMSANDTWRLLHSAAKGGLEGLVRQLLLGSSASGYETD
jgi:ankyrin repeat protein